MDFSWQLTLRVAALVVAVCGLGMALVAGGFHGLSILLAALTLGLIWELHGAVNQTNIEFSRFLDAARFDDFGGRLDLPGRGAAFEEARAALITVGDRFLAARQRQQEQIRHLSALTEHIPVPLISVFPDGRIECRNHAARRLFGVVPVRRLDDLAAFGKPFLHAISQIEPGESQLVGFEGDGLPRQLTIVSTLIVTAEVRERVISMQDIQRELDDVQLRAWRDLVRVLTHEITNSITPVASLARTAADLAQDARSRLEPGSESSRLRDDLSDIQDATNTVARRSQSLKEFIRSYRDVTALPEPKREAIKLVDLLQRASQLLVDEWQSRGIVLTTKVEPEYLELFADQTLMEQVLINLLKNAGQAFAQPRREAGDTGAQAPLVEITARSDANDRIIIEVSDNGPGIPEAALPDIFVPFFTTRQDGTGVGLALTRQIMIAHGGQVTAGRSPAGGARFRLIFG